MRLLRSIVLVLFTAISSTAAGAVTNNLDAEFLIFTGATWKNPPYYGYVMTPSGHIYRTETEAAKLATLGLDADDTVVYAFATDQYEVHPHQPPSRVILEDFSYLNIDTDVQVYSEATLGYQIGATLAELDESGALIYLGPRVPRLSGRARADSDGDGIADEDEITIYKTDPLDSDSDNDGLDDGDEITRLTDPLLADTDKDGVNDGEEVQRGLDPLAQDSDDDGLFDGEELELGLEPLDPDTDRDGIPDGEEVLAGTDPIDPRNCSTRSCGFIVRLITALKKLNGQPGGDTLPE